jgi:hypothetical protein
MNRCWAFTATAAVHRDLREELLQKLTTLMLVGYITYS